MSKATYVFFGVIAMAVFAFGAVMQIASDFVVTLVAASIMAVPVAMEMAADRRARKSRNMLLRAFANSRGWPFETSGSLYPRHSFRGLPLFEKGENQSTANTMHCTARVGPFEVPVIIGDYDYEVQRGRSVKEYKLSFLAARLPLEDLPPIIVRREKALDRVKSAIGFDDIDFESKAFSDRFYVGSPDKRFAYRLITPRVMEYLLHGSQVPGPPSFTVGGRWIGIVSPHGRWSLRDIEAARAWMEGLLGSLPEAIVTAPPPTTRVHSAP